MRILEKEKKNTKKEGIKTHKHKLAKTLKTYTECGFVTVEGRSRDLYSQQKPALYRRNKHPTSHRKKKAKGSIGTSTPASTRPKGTIYHHHHHHHNNKGGMGGTKEAPNT